MNKKILIALGAIILILIFIIRLPNNGRERTPKTLDNFAIGPSLISENDITVAKNRLSKIKTASWYEKVTDGEISGGKDLVGTVSVLKDTNTEFIFRGFWFFAAPVPESPDNMPRELADEFAGRLKISVRQVPELVRKTKYDYEDLSKSISAIKKEMPDSIFVSGFPAFAIGKIELNPASGGVLTSEDTWKIAFDPAKWNLSIDGRKVTKEGFQRWNALLYHWIDPTKPFNWKAPQGYFPDITNPDFQYLFLNWAKKQIDSGADAIWIDGLNAQARLVYQSVKDPNHPAVTEALAASSMLVDRIHEYGYSKGKYIYVGSWVTPALELEGFPDLKQNLDFVTVSYSPEEVLVKKIDQVKWEKKLSIIKKAHGNTPVFVIMDMGYDGAPLEIFSQKLTKEEQREMLRSFDESFKEMGLSFVYPLRMPYMGYQPKILAGGRFNVYDPLAPEFDTYDTIKELANKKKEK